MRTEGYISVAAALGAGWRVAVHHRVLALITALAMTWERSISIYTEWRGLSPGHFAKQYHALVMQMLHDPLHGDLRSFAELYGLLAVVAVLFAISVWVLVGVLGLIRDLLLHDGFQVRHLMRRGGEFLWRIVRFKIPLYLANSFAAVGLLLPAWLNWRRNGIATSFTLLLLLSYGAVFLGLRIWLSLGPKFIVCMESRHVFPVYSQIWRLFRLSPARVIAFQFVVLLLTSGAAVVVLGLRHAGVSWSISTVAGLLTAGFAGVMAKAASLALFLQLARLSSGLRK